MSAEIRCAYESIQDHFQIPFLSIKNRSNASELVFNPYFSKRLAKSMYSSEDLSQEDLQWICSECGLCKPIISGSSEEGFRIKRDSYDNSEAGILFQTEILVPNGEAKTFPYKICLVDDFQPKSTARGLALRGHTVLVVTVNPNIKPSELAEWEFRNRIINWEPDWLITDKGLGYVDGIDLIKVCKEAGVRTIMLTGERQTHETRRVADIFLTKPMMPSCIAEEIERYAQD